MKPRNRDLIGSNLNKKTRALIGDRLKKARLYYLTSGDLYVAIGVALACICPVCYVILPNIPEGKVLLVLLNLSYSFLAAAIFYMLQVVLIRISRTRKALRALCKGIEGLWYELAFIGQIFSAFVKFKDADEIEIMEEYDGFIYFKKKSGKHHEQSYLNVYNYLERFPEQIKDKILKLRESTLYAYLPEGLLRTVEDISQEQFLLVSAIGSDYPLVCRHFHNLGSTMNKIAEYERGLEPYLCSNRSFEIIQMQGAEREKYMEDLKKYYPAMKQMFRNGAENRKIHSKIHPGEAL